MDPERKKKHILDSTHALKQQWKRGASFVEDQAVLKDEPPSKKKNIIVAKVKLQEAVPNKNEHVTDSELQSSLMFDDKSDNNEDDLLANDLPIRKKCNMDLVYKELDKDPKFKIVSKWLKGIQGNLILPTVEPVIQTTVPGFVSTEAVGNIGVSS